MAAAGSGPIVLIGAGNMGGAMLAGWLKNGISGSSVLVIDPGPSPAMAELISGNGARHETAAPEGLKAGVLFLAVKPQVMDQVLPPLKGLVGPETVDGQPHGGVVFCADLIPGRPWVHVPITMGYDRNAELLIDEKRAFLEDKLARGVRLFFTHDPGCALAQVARDDKGRFGTAHEHADLHARALAA